MTARARPRARKRKVARRPRVVATPPTPAERRLLALARELAPLPLPAAVATLAAAWAPDAPLPREAARAWLDSRDDKTAALALAWAREQVRLSLQEVVESASRQGRGRVDAGADVLAWLLLVACEALAHEPPSAGLERVSTVLQLTGLAGAPG